MGQRGRGWKVGSPKQTEELKYHWTQSSLKGWLVCNSESRSLSVGLFVKGMGGSGVIRRAQQGTCEEGGGY